MKKIIEKVKALNDTQTLVLVILAGAALLFLVLYTATAAMSAEMPEEFTPIPGGGYVIAKDAKDRDVAMIVHTWDGMTMDKQAAYDSDDKRTHSKALPKYQELAERLLKMEDIKRVYITYKKVEIYRFPLAPSFEELAPDIEKAFKAVFEPPKPEEPADSPAETKEE